MYAKISVEDYLLLSYTKLSKFRRDKYINNTLQFNLFHEYESNTLRMQRINPMQFHYNALLYRYNVPIIIYLYIVSMSLGKQAKMERSVNNRLSPRFVDLSIHAYCVISTRNGTIFRAALPKLIGETKFGSTQGN